MELAFNEVTLAVFFLSRGREMDTERSRDYEYDKYLPEDINGFHLHILSLSGKVENQRH